MMHAFALPNAVLIVRRAVARQAVSVDRRAIEREPFAARDAVAEADVAIEKAEHASSRFTATKPAAQARARSPVVRAGVPTASSPLRALRAWTPEVARSSLL